jgi:hypothetical protein
MEVKDSNTKELFRQDDDRTVNVIRPLPDNVVPSERFLAQMRNRLLALTAESRSTAPPKAA